MSAILVNSAAAASAFKRPSTAMAFVVARTSRPSLISNAKQQATAASATRSSALSMSSSSSSSNDRQPQQQQQHLVLIGGGHAHAQVIKALHKSVRSFDVTLIDVQERASYSGMVPGAMAGKYTPSDTELALRPLAEWAGIRFIYKAVVDVDLEKKLIYLQDPKEGTKASSLTSSSARPTLLEQFEGQRTDDDLEDNTTNVIPFDVVSIDIGSTSRGFKDTPGAKQYTIPTRPISELVRRFERATQDIQNGKSVDGPLEVVVIGGGVAGIELSMSIHGRWNGLQNDNEKLNITLLDAGDTLLPYESMANQHALQNVLNDRSITVRHRCHVIELTKDHVVVDIDGNVQHLPFSHCIWSTGAEAHDLAWRLGSSPPTNDRPQRPLEISQHGWIRVQRTLQSVSHPFVFAAGDCCEICDEERDGTQTRSSIPKAGVYAVRAGPILIENLVKYLQSIRPNESERKEAGEDVQKKEEEEKEESDTALATYFPQDDFLKLIGCGNGVALGFRFGIPLYGKWVWQMKDAIDKKFMDLFRAEYLPDMDAASERKYDTSQYDAMYDERPPRLPVVEAAELIQRTDDDVDYERAWFTLRDMVDDEQYRKDVLSHVTKVTEEEMERVDVGKSTMLRYGK